MTRDKPEPVGDEEFLVDEYDRTEHVERTDVGVSIEFTMTRGSGTRDQEKVKAKTKAETFEEAREDMDRAKAYVRDELAPELRATLQEDES